MSNMAINTAFSIVIEIFRSGVCPHFGEVSPLVQVRAQVPTGN